MGLVYESAAQVIAWIGQEIGYVSSIQLVALLATSSGSSVIEVVDRFCHDIYDNNPPRFFAGESWSDRGIRDWAQVAALKIRVAHFDVSWTNTVDMFCSSYWTRLWIIQELVLARKIIVQLGPRTLRWETLEPILNHADYFDNNLISTSMELRSLATTTQARIFKLRQGTQGPLSPCSVTLFDAFHMSKNCKCADVRDKVYGIRSLSKRCCQDCMPVDYSMSTSAICVAILEHQLQSHHHDLLKYTSRTELFLQGALSFLVRDTLRALEVVPMIFLAQDADLFPFVLEEPNDSSVVDLGCRYIGRVDDVTCGETEKVDELLKMEDDPYLQTKHVVRVLIQRHQGPCWYTVYTSGTDFPVLKGDLLYAVHRRGGAIVFRRKGLKLLMVGEPNLWIRPDLEEHILPATVLLDSKTLCALCEGYMYPGLEYRPIDRHTREAGHGN